ncbi:MAG: TRAP transporter permease [Clostridia bacterium]|nr:TRAP transporter permease [Clostridia bacterium]
MENTTVKTENMAAQDIMEKFDKSARTRRFTGVFGIIVKALLCLFVCYVLGYTIFFTLERQVKLTSFLACVIMFAFLFYPATVKLNKLNPKSTQYWVAFGIDVVIGMIGAFCFLYHTFNSQAIIDKMGVLTWEDSALEIILGIIGTVILFEACRRVTGLPIIIVCLAFIVYAFIECDFRAEIVIYNIYYMPGDGILGTPLNVCATFIIWFIVFGAFLEKTGIGEFFVNLANSVVGWSAGGPAKVAVISSALMGMYSGSSVANTVGSGSITIPMMKKTGYKSEFAAAVEAAASTGGQIMPPIMGAAAFLMSEMTGFPYTTIIVAAILPAVLYYAGIFLMVHFEAKKNGLNGLPKDAIPSFLKLILKKWFLLIPIVILVVAMNFFTPAKSACIAILAVIVVSVVSGIIKSALKKPKSIKEFFKVYAGDQENLTPMRFVDSVESGAKSTISVAIACAVAGIICAVLTTTGLAGELTTALVSVGKNNLLLALFLTMLCCIVLGMGVPTTANYVIMASTTAPILIALGIPTLAAHMFVFYFGIVADITPPVALAAYAGSAIADSSPMKTGVVATKLAIAAFIIPYIFAFSPNMLFIDAVWYDVILIILSSVVGITLLSVGLEGWLLKKVPWWQRIICFAGGLLLIIPGWVTDLIGLLIGVGIVVLQILSVKKDKNAQPVMATVANEDSKDVIVEQIDIQE